VKEKTLQDRDSEKPDLAAPRQRANGKSTKQNNGWLCET